MYPRAQIFSFSGMTSGDYGNSRYDKWRLWRQRVRQGAIMATAVITTEKLYKTFSAGGVQQDVLRGLDLEIYEGDFTIIMGSSGAGKSTLLYALSGMDKPTSGGVCFKDKELTSYSEDQLAIFRRKNCGFIFQQVYLLDNMSVLDNILACGLLSKKSKRELIEKAADLLKLVDLDEVLWHKYPSQLSGGESQRVAVVRAVINNPIVVFADEPTGALNSASGKAVLDVLTEINNSGQSIIMVTHDVRSARRGNRIIYLRDGVVCGECQLDKYVSGDKCRHDKVNEFLNGMGW